eukprot:jgi/Tetstr1/445435/TSEL_033216.t1
MEAGELPAGTSRSARRRKRWRSARAQAASAEAAEGGADAAADGAPPAVVDTHRRAAKLTAVQELHRARQALDTADLAAFLASGTVFALHKDDPAAREERAKTGEPLRVRPLGVGSVLVRVASAHVLVHVGAGAREAMGPVQRSFQSGAGCETHGVYEHAGGAAASRRTMAPCNYLGAPISHYPGWMSGALGRRRVAHAAMLERIAFFGTPGYGCHHGAMRLLVVCAVRQTG